MFCKIETITPKDAAKYLKNRHPKQRKINKRWVNKLAKILEDPGSWDDENGEAIRLDVDGLLVDGQHRLEAIVKSGITAKILVVHGVSNRALFTIDAGKHRSHTDAFTMAGYKYPNAWACGLRLYIGYKNDAILHKEKYTNEYLIREAKKIPDFKLSVDSGTFHSKNFKLLPLSILVASHRIFYLKSQAQANAFMVMLCSGAGIGKNSAILKLREKLINQEILPSSFSMNQKLGLTIMAWNYYRKNISVKNIEWNKNTKFPKAI